MFAASDDNSAPSEASPEIVPDQTETEPVEAIAVKVRSTLIDDIGMPEPAGQTDDIAAPASVEEPEADEPKARRSGWWRRRG